LKENDASTIAHTENARPSGNVRLLLALLVVAAIVTAAHWPALSTRAFMFDDDQYLVENRLVKNPGWDSTERFITEVLEPSTVRGYYQPLAMISIMLDYALGGRVDNLMPFHRTSLLLHAANSLLLLILIYHLFGQLMPAVVAALLYGLHPTTIESVAWISERKTLLAAFFALACLVFYVRYLRTNKRTYYLLCLPIYVLSLLSKPAIIAMPVLMLLLDFWPFRRLNRRAILEKIPLFAIAAGAALITFISQSRTSLATTPGQSGAFRILLTICHNIVFYLYNFLWPNHLSWYYPFPKPFNLSQPMLLIGVIGTLLLITALLISIRWTRSLLIGWLFFFAAIFPTLGIVGFHPVIAADRHMYFPMIGFLLPVAWMLGRISPTGTRTTLRRIAPIAICAILMASEFTLIRCYLVYWRDSEKLYTYMLTRSPDVAILHNNLANVLSDADDPAMVTQAVKHFQRSLQLKPNSPEVYNNLANALSKLGRSEDAIKHYKKALSLRPKFAVAHYNLAAALATQGQNRQAIAQYRQAVQDKPDYVEAWTNLGIALAAEGDFEQAVTCYSKALEYEPTFVLAHGQLSLTLARLGKIDDAIEHIRIVLKALPNDKEMHFNIAVLLEYKGRTDQAVQHYRRALKIDPNYQQARQRLRKITQTQKDTP